MEELLGPMIEQSDELRHFHATYTRVTKAVEQELERGVFRDNGWVEAWDVAFADLYLQALQRWRKGEEVPAPWSISFGATRGRRMPPLRHVLLGTNAHVNYDLPQALIATSDEGFDEQALVERRRSDHTRMDAVLAARVAAEDREVIAESRPGDRTPLDRLLVPFNRLGTKRFLKEAREKCWHNARQLSLARRRGPDQLKRRLGRLEELSAARVADLTAPGQVVLKLAARGFGVRLD